MTSTELGARVRAILSEHLAKTTHHPPEVTNESKLIEDLNFDSLDVIEASMDLEEALDLELDDEKVAELVTVADLCAYLADLVGVAEVAA